MLALAQESIRSLLPRLHYFDEGTCIVHHMFGAETTNLVRKAYGDALLTAHFEVCLSTLMMSQTWLSRCMYSDSLSSIFRILAKSCALLEVKTHGALLKCHSRYIY